MKKGGKGRHFCVKNRMEMKKENLSDMFYFPHIGYAWIYFPFRFIEKTIPILLVLFLVDCASFSFTFFCFFNLFHDASPSAPAEEERGAYS